MLVPRCAVTLGVTLLLTSSSLLAPASAAPPGWTDPDRIPGTLGDFNQISATAPDGSDVVVWIDDGSTTGAQIKARLRSPGSESWRRVSARVDNRVSVQDLAIAETPDGDFWLAWVNYSGSTPEVFAMRLDVSTRRWTKPTKVFSSPDYYHASPSIAVAGDGTVVLGAIAEPVVPTTPPTYRAIVGTLAPGGSHWTGRYLSPSTTFAFGTTVAAGSRGHLAVGWIRGYDLADMTVRVAARAPGAKATWHSSTLSAAGDSQRVRDVAVGADGTAAVVWVAPSSGSTTARLATTRIRKAASMWTVRDLQPAGATVSELQVAVSASGTVTGVWGMAVGSARVITARSLVAGVLGAAVPVSAAGEVGVIHSLLPRNDGRVALLHQQFTTGISNLGLRYRLIGGNMPTGDITVTDGANPSENQPALGVNAAGAPSVVFTRGFPPPDTDFAALGGILRAPVVLAGAFSSRRVSRARIIGPTRVGRVVGCASGFWVEAAGLSFTWRRDGNRIAGETARRYLIRVRDGGHELSCALRAANDAGVRKIASTRHRVTR